MQSICVGVSLETELTRTKSNRLSSIGSEIVLPQSSVFDLVRLSSILLCRDAPSCNVKLNL